MKKDRTFTNVIKNGDPARHKRKRRKKTQRRSIDLWTANNLSLENAAAIAAEFRQDGRYWDFYDRYCEQLSGFCGIWTFLGFAGARFTLLWPAGDEFDWVESIQTVVDVIYRAALEGEYQTDIQSADWVDQAVCRARAEMKNPEKWSIYECGKSPRW